MARKADKQITRQLQANGWYLHRVSKHEIWRCSCGVHQITKSVSMGKGRSDKNLKAVLKRQGDCSFTIKFG